MKVYVMTFIVTMTCNNGNERTFHQHVYCPIDRPYSEEQRINIAIASLKQKHFYHIQYVSTKVNNLIVI